MIYAAIFLTLCFGAVVFMACCSKVSEREEVEEIELPLGEPADAFADTKPERHE